MRRWEEKHRKVGEGLETLAAQETHEENQTQTLTELRRSGKLLSVPEQDKKKEKHREQRQRDRNSILRRYDFWANWDNKFLCKKKKLGG